MMVEQMEEVLSEDDEDSEASDESMEESKDYEDDVEMSNEVDDLTILRKFQEGLQIESLAQKGSILPLITQKKGRNEGSEEGITLHNSIPPTLVRTWFFVPLPIGCFFVIFFGFLPFSLLLMMAEKLNILGLNCRGSSSKDKLNWIRAFMNYLNLDIIALLETRTDESRVSHVCDKFSKYWNWLAIISDGFSGEIIILWIKHIGGITLVAHSHRALHLIISPPSKNKGILLVVYKS